MQVQEGHSHYQAPLSTIPKHWGAAGGKLAVHMALASPSAPQLLQHMKTRQKCSTSFPGASLPGKPALTRRGTGKAPQFLGVWKPGGTWGWGHPGTQHSSQQELPCELGTDSSAVFQGDSREILIPLSSTKQSPGPEQYHGPNP